MQVLKGAYMDELVKLQNELAEKILATRGALEHLGALSEGAADLNARLERMLTRSDKNLDRLEEAIADAKARAAEFKPVTDANLDARIKTAIAGLGDAEIVEFKRQASEKLETWENDAKAFLAERSSQADALEARYKTLLDDIDLSPVEIAKAALAQSRSELEQATAQGRAKVAAAVDDVTARADGMVNSLTFAISQAGKDNSDQVESDQVEAQSKKSSRKGVKHAI
jgi:hypothetical protein